MSSLTKTLMLSVLSALMLFLQVLPLEATSNGAKEVVFKAVV